MKFKCPYCRHEFGPEPQALCPSCRKAMIVPNRFQKHSFRDRKRAKKAIRRDADMKRAELFVPSTRFGRQPSFLLFGLAALVVVGGFLIKGTMSSGGPTADEGLTDPMAAVEGAGRSVDALRVAVERFRRDCGRYPETREGLTVLLLNPGLEGWRNPYIRWLVCDPWGHPYFYEYTNNAVTIISRGPDGLAGTADDIIPREPTAETVDWDKTHSSAPLPTNPQPARSPESIPPDAPGLDAKDN